MIERDAASLVERFFEEFDGQHAAWLKQAVRIADEVAEQLEAIRSPIERQARFIIVHLGSERVDYLRRNIGRVGDDRIERAFIIWIGNRSRKNSGGFKLSALHAVR